MLDADWRFTFMNRRAMDEVAGGRDLTGLCLREEHPHVVNSVFWDKYHAVMQGRLPATFEAYDPAPLDTWYEVNAYPAQEGIAVFFRNIGERRAEEERQKLLISELSQRVKNTLATVHALAPQAPRSTFSANDSRRGSVAHLFPAHRPAASATHDVPRQDNQQGAELSELVA